MLSVFLNAEDTGLPWKQVVQAQPGHFTHHIQLQTAGDLNRALAAALHLAYAQN